ncbi:MAG: VWA domain-containing protein [Deltaproteobacteria bacterium]|nr:VWA domain-containing protein [Deltaproteobacteria bacterium]
MRLLVPLGLLVAVAVIGPLVAHLLRRRRPEERLFPAARLVPTAPPVARRRAHLEDRTLLLLRAIAILALALLAASPLVRCQRLALDRHGGASVALAIVIDDSMSMRAELPPGARRGGARTRFELAIVAARELAGSLRSGDATTIVLAGAPARVALAATQEASVVRAAIERIAQDGGGDRATDLDAAIALASAAIAELPQPDRRVVLLSDLADGNPAAAPLAELAGVHVEAPIEGLKAPPPQGLGDCALLAATPEGAGDAVRAKLSCTIEAVGQRAIEIVTVDDARLVVGRAAFPPNVPSAPQTFDVLVPVDVAKAGPLTPAAGKPRVHARIVGEKDAIATDDLAPVLGSATAPAIGVVVAEGGALEEIVATGGAPVLERGLGALQAGVPIRPISSVPDRETELAAFAGIAVDDPSGFGPETRMALARWIDAGGVLLLAVGPHAATPPLGSSFEPLLARPLKWERVQGPLGVDPKHAGPLGDGVEPASNLAPLGRAIIDREDESRFVVRAKFGNGAPLLLTRAQGQGELWLVTLPFSPELSDLPVRPSFLALLDAFVARARDRGAGARLTVGDAWTVGPSDAIDARILDERGNPLGEPLTGERSGDGRRVRPGKIGAWLVEVVPKGGSAHRDVRAVAPAPAEVDLRPRPLAPTIATAATSGLSRQTTELGPMLALFLVGLAAIELFARVLRLLFGAHPVEEGARESMPPAT